MSVGVLDGGIVVVVKLGVAVGMVGVSLGSRCGVGVAVLVALGFGDEVIVIGTVAVGEAVDDAVSVGIVVIGVTLALRVGVLVDGALLGI